jgi:hypothetical protein
MQQPRQMYGLGSLVKSITKGVKGAVKGVADVAKSPLGLAALATIPFGGPTAALGALKTGAGNFLFGTGLPTGPRGAANKGLFGMAKDFFGGEKTFGKTAAMFGLGSLGGSALAALEASGVEDPGQIRDVETLKIQLANGYKLLNPEAEEKEVDAFVEANTTEYRADGGRIGFDGGGYTFEQFLKDKQQVDEAMSMEQLRREYERQMQMKKVRDQRNMAANGGRIGYAMGSAEENAMQASGIMGLPLNENPAGVKELDLRETGGFIPPVGVKEKADDIPAMLSNNEFVFTADAVRGMGGGDVNKGAQRLYDQMKMLEKGGRV